MNRKNVFLKILVIAFVEIFMIGCWLPGVKMSASSEVHAGVKAGDWIKYDYTIIGGSPEAPVTTWVRVEVLNVKEKNVTLNVTIHMSDGTEQNRTKTLNIVNVVAIDETLGTFSGFVIPANLTTGDAIYIKESGELTIDGETTKIYAGARRTVVYISFSWLWRGYGFHITYFWDKQYGIMVEASLKSSFSTVVAKATETNIWQPQFLLFSSAVFYVLVIVAIVTVIAAFFVVLRRKRSQIRSQSSESTKFLKMPLLHSDCNITRRLLYYIEIWRRFLGLCFLRSFKKPLLRAAKMHMPIAAMITVVMRAIVM